MNTIQQPTTAIAKPEKAILMKSGAVQWVALETAEKVESHLANQQGHSFIRLKDYDLTINTAEIDGVYTPEQYADIQKAKNGYWQCEYKGWHFRKEKCECAGEAMRKKKQEEDERKRAEMAREDTPEERARRQDTVVRMREQLYIKGTFGGGGEVRESTLKAWEAENGPISLERRKSLKIIKGK